MRYHIHHHTGYTYQPLAQLSPHIVRLRPRCDGWQTLLNYHLKIDPTPDNIGQINDLEGNNILQIWFTEPTEKLIIETDFEVETLVHNPFIFQLDPWALKLPFDYPTSVLTSLKPYLTPYSLTPDPVAAKLAQEICHQAHQNPLDFLFLLNQTIYQNCEYTTRESGDPHPASITWKYKRGSCRDFSLLFMEVCRAMGLGARFVSGYQEGDPDQDNWDLHGWVEVYLPGGGWRGYDPTLGLAVSDRHIALVASYLPVYTAPVVGQITPAKVISEMTSHIKIVRL